MPKDEPSYGRQENPLGSFWIRQLTLRQAILYAGIHRMLQEGRKSVPPWQLSLFDHARHTREEDLPPMEYPF